MKSWIFIADFLQESLIEQASTFSEDDNKGNDNGSTFTQGTHTYDVLDMSTTCVTLEQPIMETTDEISLSPNNMLVVCSDKRRVVRYFTYIYATTNEWTC